MEEVDATQEIADDSRVTDEVNGKARPLAPWWHTTALLMMLAVWAVLGPMSVHSHSALPLVGRYVSSMMSQGMQLCVVVAGLYHRRAFFLQTLARGARSWWVEMARGGGIFLLVMAMFVVLHIVMRVLRLKPGFDSEATTAMAPRSGVQLAVLLMVSVTVGFCEEHVFRGYLLQQMKAWMRGMGAESWVSSCLAVLMTSLVFGSLHVYEGWGGAIFITALGVVYAVIALRVGNLRALIVAHALQDFAAGWMLMMRHGAA